MKKITLTTLVLLLACLLTAQAGPIDQQKARQLAAQFMQKKGLQLKGEPRRAPGVSGTGSNEAQPLYIFNTDGAKGFVIVAGDDRADAILGYSTEGSYDEQNLPDNFRFYLQLLSSNMQALMESEASSRHAVAIHNAIAPLIQTKWNQGSATADGYIYNTMCPTLSGKHCLTGCVATAGAQIMYYYQYPESTEGVEGYQANYQYTSINDITVQGLPETSFEWDKMKLSYTASDQGTEEQEEVAKLMLYAGFAAQMKYGTGGSSANPGVLAEGMIKYFDYDPYTYQYIKRASYSVSEWDEIMYNELENGRPIIYSGDSEVEGGHAFICDGYDGEGLYHFNWGWGGNYDGYFKLSATNPYPGTYNNDGILYDGFVNDIDAVIGLQPKPNTGEIPEENTDNIVATARNITIDNTTISMIVANECNEDHKFGFGMGELNSDGSIDVIDNSYEYYKGTVLPAGYSFSEPLTFDFASYKLSEGTHKLVPMCLIAGETEWKRCKPSLVYFEVEVAGDGSMTITQHPTVELEATQIEVTGNKIETLVQQVDVTVESKSDDYQGPLYLFASKTEDKGAYTYLAGTAIEGGASDVVTFYFTPATAGTWNLWIATDEAGNDIIGHGQATAEIGEAPTGEVTLEVSDETLTMEGDEATLTFKITNTGSTPNYRDIPTICWRKNEERPGYFTGEINTITSNTTIEPGETKEYSVTYSGMKDQCWYMIEIYQYSSFSDANYRDNSIADHEFTFDANATAITLPEADRISNDETYYTLNGQRMSGRPNKAGIYIHKGKKVIVR